MAPSTSHGGVTRDAWVPVFTGNGKSAANLPRFGRSPRSPIRMKMVFAAFLAIAPAMSVPGAVPATSDNPLLEPSVLPYQMPPFDRIRVSDYAPAFEETMRQQLREVAAIAHNPKPPTFENTIVELDRSGQARQRVSVMRSEARRRG